MVVVAGVAIVLSLGGSSAPKREAAGRSRAPASHVAHRAGTGGASAHPASHHRPAAPAPGSLPQTHALPLSTTAHFRSLMAALWAGVVHDSVSGAMPAFFPKAAYLQVKAIPDAGGDFENRLVHGFRLDIGAAHALLGANAASARLVGVRVPQQFAHWVDPGACNNRIGYYEVPNARVVYSENGQVRSFGIASMISWRGVWYVVHFGAVLASGVVDAPAAGPSSSIDTGTC
ncbi:MAG: hypothetical protein JO342_19490 [Solirubrobacterales bacterium]|nr:hypothetical protein [Solirubrobacterales bacterium]